MVPPQSQRQADVGTIFGLTRLLLIVRRSKPSSQSSPLLQNFLRTNQHKHWLQLKPLGPCMGAGQQHTCTHEIQSGGI
jgi:hypothetical protein